MFYLFIFESIGTSELFLIGIVALIIFGPRKLPEMMRTVGKAVAEFRRSTDDFKKTWEKEINFEKNEFNILDDSDLSPRNQSKNENSVGRMLDSSKDVVIPQIIEINQDNFSMKIPEIEASHVEKVKLESNSSDKRNWL